MPINQTKTLFIFFDNDNDVTTEHSFVWLCLNETYDCLQSCYINQKLHTQTLIFVKVDNNKDNSRQGSKCPNFHLSDM